MSTHTLTQAEPRRWAMFIILLVGAFCLRSIFLLSMWHCLQFRASWAPRPLLNSSSFRPMLPFTR